MVGQIVPGTALGFGGGLGPVGAQPRHAHGGRACLPIGACRRLERVGRGDQFTAFDGALDRAFGLENGFRLTGVLLVGTAADDAGPREAVVEVVAGVAGSRAAQGVEVGLAGPRPFGQVDAVVFEQRTFAVVHLCDRHVVVDQRSEVLVFRLGEALEGIQVEVDRIPLVLGIDAGHPDGAAAIDFVFGGQDAAEIRLRGGIVFVDFADRAGELVAQFEFLFLEHCPISGEGELGVADAGHLLAESEGDRQFQSELPFLVSAAGHRSVSVGHVAIRVDLPGSLDEDIAQAEPAVAAHRVQSRQEIVLCGDQFKFALLDDPFLAAELDASRQPFGQNFVPIEPRHRPGGFVRGAEQPPVGRRKAERVAEHVFVLEQVGLRLLDDRLEEEILVSCLGFALDRAAFGLDVAFDLDRLPRPEGAVAAGHGRVESSVGEVEVPVGPFHVVHEVADPPFEIRQADVGPQPGDHHAVVEAGNRAGAGDSVVLDARPLHQRLAELGLEIDVPIARPLPRTGGVVPLVFDIVRERPGAAGGRRLLELGLEGSQVLCKNPGPKCGDEAGGVLRCVVLLPKGACGELRVECGKGRLDAVTGIALGEGRQISGRRAGGVRQQSAGFSLHARGAKRHSAKASHDLAVLQRDSHGVFERDVFDFDVVEVDHRGRRHRPFHLVEAAQIDVGIFDLGRHADVVGEVAVFVQVERLLGITADQQGNQRDSSKEAAIWEELPNHGVCVPATGCRELGRSISAALPPGTRTGRYHRHPLVQIIGKLDIGSLTRKPLGFSTTGRIFFYFASCAFQPISHHRTYPSTQTSQIH